MTPGERRAGTPVGNLVWGETRLGDPGGKSPVGLLERVTCGTPRRARNTCGSPRGQRQRGGLAAGLGGPGRAVLAWGRPGGRTDPRGFVSCQLTRVLPPQNPDITITDNVLHFRGRGSTVGSQPGPHARPAAVPVVPIAACLVPIGGRSHRAGHVQIRHTPTHSPLVFQSW